MSSSTSAKPFVFTLMPFHNDFNDIWKLGIKETCESVGSYCERVDEQVYDERILDRIYNQINKADIIVADMTGKNPNVFYEVGYAHALNKRVLLIVQEESDIPFDLKHHPFIIYKNSITTLQKELKTKVEYFLSNPESRIIPDTKELQFFIRGEQITEGCILNFEQQKMTDFGYGISFEFDFLNNSTSVYNDIKIGLITESRFPNNNTNDIIDYIIQPDKRILHLIKKKYKNIFPNSYQKISFRPTMNHRTTPLLVDEECAFTLRAFSSMGTTDLNFKIHNTRGEEAPW